ncbi:GcrA family cell cycle regulator, partial [Camelimonas abortus]
VTAVAARGAAAASVQAAQAVVASQAAAVAAVQVPLAPETPAPPPPVVAADPAAAPESQRVTIMELRENMCRWPMGDPTSADFCFCGNRTTPGVPYCDFHSRIAYQPPERRRDRRGN